MAEVERIAAFAAGLGNVERVDVLPFHQMGRFKWEKLGMDYQLKDTQPPSRATTDEAIAIFRAAGLKAVSLDPGVLLILAVVLVVVFLSVFCVAWVWAQRKDEEERL